MPRVVAAYLETGILGPEPDLEAQRATLLSHYESMLLHHGRDPGMRLARKHVAWYSKGLPGSAEFRAEVNRIDDADAVVALIRRFYEPLVERGVARERPVKETTGEATGDDGLMAA